MIREGNLEFNKAGILNNNSKDNIVSCPFCGVGQMFIGDDCSEMLSLADNMDAVTLKIIENAIIAHYLGYDKTTKTKDWKCNIGNTLHIKINKVY